MDEMAAAIVLLSGARRHREWAAARDAILDAWAPVVAQYHVMRNELGARQALASNADDAGTDAIAKVAILENALRVAIAERDAADLRMVEAVDKLKEYQYRGMARDAWVLVAERVTEAAKAWRRSPMSDEARKRLAEAVLALEAS